MTEVKLLLGQTFNVKHDLAGKWKTPTKANGNNHRERTKKEDKRAALLQLNGMKLDVAKSVSELYIKKRHAAEEYNRFQLITDCGVYMSYVAQRWREKEKLTCYFSLIVHFAAGNLKFY